MGASVDAHCVDVSPSSPEEAHDATAARNVDAEGVAIRLPEWPVRLEVGDERHRRNHGVCSKRAGRTEHFLDKF